MAAGKNPGQGTAAQDQGTAAQWETPMGRHAAQTLEAGKPVQEIVASVVEALKRQAEDGSGALPKGNLKDSVFTDLFQIPEYAFQLYRSLHPEDTEATVEQIKPATLANVLLDQQYNDLAIAVRDRLLILLEHQSTWTPNIIVRILIYYVMILNGFLFETRQNLYTTTRLSFPKPEFYIVYTGERKKRPEVVRLTEEFFGGADADLEVKVHMFYGDGSGSVLDQFVEFSGVYAEQFGLHGRTKETVRETLRICMERGILREYLEGRRKEVEDILTTLFDENYLMETYTREVELRGEKRGELRGEKRGELRGEKRGREDGRNEAKKETAERLYQRGNSLVDIADIVGCPVEKVEQWLGLVSV